MHAVNPLETPAFKRFFRDSAVVDREGRPMVVYHGTTAGDFEAFRPHYRKDEQLGFGIHFAESYELADMYAHDPSVRRRGVKKPRVIGAYLSIQRPLYADRVVFEGMLEYALAVELAGVKLSRMPYERDDKGRRMLYVQACIDATGVERAERLIRQAGYDGVCYTATMMDSRGVVGGGPAWVVFEANQIKSVDNVGTYNPEDPRMRHNVPPPKGAVYYHGTPRQAAAESIMANGLKPGAVVQGRGFLAPVAGKVYMTPSLSYGIIYALGGDIAGHASPLISAIEEQYGYLFVVPSDRLTDIQPDEDFVGELTGAAFQTPEALQQYWPRFAGRVPAWLRPLAETRLSPRQLMYVKGGEYIWQAAAGKKLLKVMTDRQKQEIIDLGASVASEGSVMPSECWRIDKRRSSELKRDGSNFFQIAEKVDMPRQNPTKPPYSLYKKRGPRPWRIGAEDLYDLDLGSRPKVPDIDPYRKDLQDDRAPSSPEDVLWTYNPRPGTYDVYLAWVPLVDLPAPVLVEEEDALDNERECERKLRGVYSACCEAEGADEDICAEEYEQALEECLSEVSGYDWTELQMGTRRGGYPAPKLFIEMKELPQEGVWERGEMSYLDGNHRMRFFFDNDYDAVLLWVVQRVPAVSARRNPTQGVASPFPPDFSTSYYPDFPPETWSAKEVEDLLGNSIEYGFPPPFFVENVPDRGPLEINVWGGDQPDYFNTWRATPHQGGYIVEGPG